MARAETAGSSEGEEVLSCVLTCQCSPIKPQGVDPHLLTNTLYPNQPVSSKKQAPTSLSHLLLCCSCQVLHCGPLVNPAATCVCEGWQEGGCWQGVTRVLGPRGNRGGACYTSNEQVTKVQQSWTQCVDCSTVESKHCALIHKPCALQQLLAHPPYSQPTVQHTALAVL